MAKNLRTAMALLRDNDCYRFGNDLVVKATARVAHSDIRVLLDRGYATILDGGNRVFITEKGLAVNHKNKICYRTRQSALNFLNAHDRFVFREGYFIAPNGKRLSVYAAQHLLDKGLLVQSEIDVYVPRTRTLEVPGDILPAVRAFVEMLERARN